MFSLIILVIIMLIVMLYLLQNLVIITLLHCNKNKTALLNSPLSFLRRQESTTSKKRCIPGFASMTKDRFNKTNCKGYSMLELVLAAAVGSVIIAGGYTSFVILSKQYSRVSAFSEVQQSGIPSLRLISRDLRMAGRVAMDTNVEPVWGAIATPIFIADSGDACCDSITVIYDKDSTFNPQRCQITYDIQPRTNPARNALYMTVTTLFSDAGDTCLGDGSSSLVADYIDDLQFVGSDNNSNNQNQLVDVSITARSMSTLSSTNTYTRPAQTIGNYDFSFTDNFHRDEFTTTVNIKNLREN